MSKNTYRRKWLVGDNGKWVLIALLVFAFPVGLYLMWSEARWRLWIKILVTAAWGAVLLVGIPYAVNNSLEYDKGSIEITARTKQYIDNREMLAPLPPEELPDTSQLLKSPSETSTLISLPTPTPVPTRVYCNDNGEYYHLEGCRYVYSTTPKVTLTQALNAGKTACPLCNPPKEETYGQ
ncbi:MAG: hypothetical protein IKR85_05910 [Clostridia bacterium]|nr:hypothetical protein [Clostridia bacterium]